MTAIPGGHSPLGASGMKRWSACAFSIFAMLGLPEGDDDESEFASLGTAAHSVVEHCLIARVEPWTLIGRAVYDGHLTTPNFTPDMAIPIDADMATAAAAMVTAINTAHPDRDQGNSWVERRFHCPGIHRLFYGMSDFTFWDEAAKTIHVWDYKHGQGVIVEAKDNPQGLYYAAGIVEDLGLWNEVDHVVIHIVQPRASHFLGPHRTWEVTIDYLDEWVSGKLIPAMDLGEAVMTPKQDEHDKPPYYEVPDPVPGDHCQFCPVRHMKCPAFLDRISRMEALVQRYETKGIETFTPAERAAIWDMFDRLRTMNTANNKELEKLFASGQRVPGLKQITGKADRKWPETVQVGDKAVPFAEFVQREFGDAGFTAREPLSPAQIEKVPLGKTFATRHAFKPPGRLNIARDTDTRPEVSRDTKSLFKPIVKKG